MTIARQGLKNDVMGQGQGVVLRMVTRSVLYAPSRAVFLLYVMLLRCLLAVGYSTPERRNVGAVEGRVFWRHGHDTVHASAGRQLAGVRLPVGASALLGRRCCWRRLHLPSVRRPRAHHGARRRRRSQGRSAAGPTHDCHGSGRRSTDLLRDCWARPAAALRRLNAPSDVFTNIIRYVSEKKTRQSTFDHNVGECRSIFKLLLPIGLCP